MASKRAIRRKAQRRSCTTKRRFETQAEAKAEVRRKVYLHKTKPGHARPGFLTDYKCGFCGGWHVGHKRFPNSLTRFMDKGYPLPSSPPPTD